MIEEALKLVSELNDRVFFNSCIEDYTPFEFKGYSFECRIFFMDVCLQSEDNDEREYINEHKKESLETFIIRESNKILNDLNKRMKEIS